MKKIIVTGASRGLGLAIVQILLHEGYYVIGTSRTESTALKEVVADFSDRFTYRRLDVSNLEEVERFGREIVKEEGRIYGLVNNAGIGTDGILATMHRTDIQQIVATNLLGPMILTKYIMRSMLAKKEGRIINISSIIASTGFHGLAVYGATKAGLEGFTRSLSREAGKLRVTVNCVAPGYMETEMTASLAGDKLESVRRRAPLGLPHPKQVAAAVSYLLSDSAAAVTGTVLTVDGGSTA
ncbi:SDR family NAD(P)-dependent oxidoreductase [Agrobacterium sp.]|uniref:SDR family NAD(P)-dependent oxidoreductase n=1 Tax=Agrobacterium sp. TaxID=361 RepID=UPI0028A916C3|nr:SDR family oxidoreductase [Agrobacterium sp.]